MASGSPTVAELPPLPPGFALDQPQASGDLPPLPSGFTLDSQQPAQPSREEGSGATRNAYGGYWEPLLHVGSSMAATPVAGIAGIGARALEAVGVLPQNAGAETVERVQSAMTYEPRTEAGQAGARVISYPFEKIAQAADTVGDAINTPGKPGTHISGMAANYGLPPVRQNETEGSPLRAAAATVANVGLQALPATLLKGRGRSGELGADVTGTPPVGRPAGRPATASANSARPAAGAAGLEGVPQGTLQVGRQAGYKFKPSETGAGAGSVVEGLTGSAKLETSLVFKNQKNSNRLVREEFGLPDGAITSERIADLKRPHNRVYDEVARVGEIAIDKASWQKEIGSIGRTPGTSFAKDVNPVVEKLKDAYIEETRFHSADAVLRVRKLRADSRKNIRSPDPEKQDLGYAQRKVADAIERQIERHGQATGKSDLMTRFKDARQQLARINTLDDAVRGGEVSAPVLARMLERDVPLSGNLQVIARVAKDYPNVMREARKVKGNTPVNMTETLIGGATLLAGQPGLLPLVAARPLTRAYLTSDRYQNRLARPSAQKAPRNALRTYERESVLTR